MVRKRSNLHAHLYSTIMLNMYSRSKLMQKIQQHRCSLRYIPSTLLRHLCNNFSTAMIFRTRTVLIYSTKVPYVQFFHLAFYKRKFLIVPCYRLLQLEATMSNLIFSLFVLLLSHSIFVNGLYFHMGETEKKCFIQDIAENTTVTGNSFIHTIE